MAASIVVPGRVRPDVRELAARAAARTAPRGPGLARVVALPVRGPAGGSTTAVLPRTDRADQQALDQEALVEQRRAAIRVVPAPGRSRRRVTVAAVAAALMLLMAVALTGGVLDGPAQPVAAGHVVLQPGETLWDVAVRSAPAGVDPRRQLDTIRRLNGFGPGGLDAWTVVLIPAP
jgi:hypothetical protein